MVRPRRAAIKSVFITGGTSGIGAQMAKDYFAMGFRVGVCGRSKSNFLKNIRNENISFYEADVSNREIIYKAIQDFSRDGLDILIASAGIGHSAKNAIPDYEDCNKLVDINIKGFLHSFEAASEVFKRQGRGHLVGISSLAALNGLPGAPAYSASKGFILSFCESIQLSLKQFNIDVTCILPGFIDTPLTKKNKHPMPFLQSVESSSKKFIKAIERKEVNYIHPKIFGYMASLLGKLPRAFFRFIISKSSFNYTKH